MVVSASVAAGRFYRLDMVDVTGMSPDRRSGRLRPGEVRRVLPPEVGGTPTFADHLRRHGPLPPARPSDGWRREMIDAVARSGLVGRGGAGFPTATKLRAVSDAPGRPVVIANGTEGEPVVRKDRVLLNEAPHLVLDGAMVAARIVDATEVVVVVHAEVLPAVQAAAEDRRGTDPDANRVRVVCAGPGFVSGEASAVVNLVGRSRAVPTTKPPHLAERGLRGRPTLVQNVETLAHMALIARHGPEWFRLVGSEAEPGSMLVTVEGAVERPGVFEVAIGAPFAQVLGLAGGTTEELQAVLIGGYSGQWLPADRALGSRFCATELGTGLGAGLVSALPVSACGVVETARIARYLASESAGQCGPCAFGLPAVAGELESLASGRLAGPDDLERFLREIPGRGACGHPDGAVGMVSSALDVFASEVAEHRHGRCTARPAVEVPPIGAAPCRGIEDRR